MSTTQPPIRFFLGSNTANGFVSTTDLYHTTDRVYLLKGGPGCGKSTLLRRLYDSFGDEDTEVFYCAADPRSIDAIRIPSRHLCVMDATAPHVVEPRYWVAVEQPILLGDCLDVAAVQRNRDAILALTDQNRALHARCTQYLQKANALLTQARRLQAAQMDTDKIDRLARRLAENEWRGLQTNTVGVSEQRFLGAITPDGFTVLYETMQALCPRIYTIEDEYGAAAEQLLRDIRRRALADGLRCVSCPSPLFPDAGPEHLLLPDIGLGFTVSNRFHTVDFPAFRRIHASRFLPCESLHPYRARLSFLRRAATELLREAVEVSMQAKTVHDQLETYYIQATDPAQQLLLGDRILEQLT